MAERELTLRLTFDNQASSALQQVIDDLEQLGIHTRQIQDSMREFGEFRGAFNEAFGDLGQPITSLADLNSQISALAGSAAASGVMMLGDAIKQSITDFIEFETQLGDLGRTANLSGEATNALGESLRKMALVDLKGQASAQELANIATIAGTLGMSASKDIEAFTAAIVRLSVATGENTEKVANNFARLGGLFETQFTARGENVYQSFDKIGSAFDALNDQIANVSFDPFMNISVRIGKMTASMGMSIDQTAAFAASINSLGFTAEAGSTAFKKFVTVIQSDSEKVAKAFTLPVDEFVTAVRERPAEAITMLLTQMNKMGSEGGAAMQDVAARMKQVWGSGLEVNDLMLAMSQNVDRVNQALKISNDEYEKGTRTFDSFAEKAKLTESQWKAVDTNLKDISLTMGTLLAPAVKTVTEELAESSRFWAEAFSRKNVDSFFDAIVGGAEQTIAPLQQLQQMDLEGKFAVDWPRALGGADDALSKMRELYQEQESVIKSNSGLSAMFVEVFQQVETATKAGIEPSAELQQQMLSLHEQISEVGQSSSNIDDLNAKLDASKTSAQGFVESTKAGWEMMVTGAATAAKQYAENWQTGVEMIIKYFEQGWETIKAKTEQLWINVSETSDQAWQAMSGKISETWQSLMTAIDQQWQGIVTSIQSTGSTLWTSITESGKQVWTDLTTAANEFWTWLTEQPSAFVTAAQTAFLAIETQIKAIPANVTAAFSGIAASARNELSKITDGLPSSVQKLLGMGGGGIEKITLPIDTAPTLDALSQIRASVIATGDEALRLKVNDVFSQMQKAIRDNVPVSDELQQKFTDVTQELETLGYVSHGGSVWPDMGAAINAVKPLAQQLQTQFVTMTGDLKTMGEQSSLPIVKQQIEDTEARIRELKKSYGDARDAEKDMSSGASARAKALGAEIKGLKASIADNTRTVFGVEEVQQVEARIAALEREKASLTGRGAAGAAGSKQIKDAIEQEQEKLRQLKDSAKDLDEVERERERAAKEAERAAKARNDASERLFKDAQRNEELLEKAAEDRDKAEAAAFQARKREADESVQWINKLDEADKKRLFGNKEALQILESQGVVLDELQQTAVWRMEREYEVAEAQQLQLETLQAQLDPMGALLDASGQLSEGFGGLSSGIGNLGDLFGFDTSGIEGFLGKAQQLAELPSKLAGLWDSMKGIGSALSALGQGGAGLGSAVSGLLGLGGAAATAGTAVAAAGATAAGATAAMTSVGAAAASASAATAGLGTAAAGATAGSAGLTSSLGAAAAAAAPFAIGAAAIGAAIWGVTKLLQDTKSAGTEAAEAFRGFVADNIAGGAELAAAYDQAFDVMTANNFDYAASLEASRIATEGVRTSSDVMSQVMGGLSANWQQGSTAMDIFTQAVGRATGDMEKAPQVALQMMMGFDSMGLSAQDAGAKMLEIAQAAGLDQTQLAALQAALDATATVEATATGATAALTGATDSASGSTLNFAGMLSSLSSTGSLTETQMSALGNAFGAAGGDSDNAAGAIAGLTDALGQAGIGGKDADAILKAFAASLEKIPEKKTVKIQIETEGKVPELAAGGVASGLAIVNERGSEIAKFPSGRMALMTQPGPVLGAFPAGTEIIPHGRSMDILRRYPNMPRMEKGGTVTPAAAGAVNNYYLTINASVIDRQVIKEIDDGLRRLTARRA